MMMTKELELSPVPEVRGCQEACLRCLRLSDALTPEQYVTGHDGQSPIGAHMRHCVEHFVSFLQGVESGLLDYDQRKRDPAIERDPVMLHAAMAEILEQLAVLGAEDLSRPVMVRLAPAAGSPPRSLTSTLGREIVFLSSHTIHHLALMLLLARMIGAAPPDELGVAYSTEAYQKRIMKKGRCSGPCAR